MKQSTHIMVIYDGIANSVFDGQVIAPLMNYRANNLQTPIILISFEKDTNPDNYETLRNRLHAHNISLIITRKYPLLSLFALTLAQWQLKRILINYASYHLVARGPLAGYICMKASEQAACSSLTIQARGLLAAEYDYATSELTRIARYYHRYKIALFTRIERYVYAPNSHIIIEAVSSALKEYLCTTYGTQPEQVIIAHHDIPAALTPAQKKLWRNATRTTLGIKDTAHIYCYNGSAKAWQCPKETLDYFYSHWQKDSNRFLLILTQDTHAFEDLIIAYKLPTSCYRIMHVPHTQIYQFLAACDTGIIFRDAHIINWISRPTKILEYRAAGLAIVHNHTIAMLTTPNT